MNEERYYQVLGERKQWETITGRGFESTVAYWEDRWQWRTVPTIEKSAEPKADLRTPLDGWPRLRQEFRSETSALSIERRKHCVFSTGETDQARRTYQENETPSRVPRRQRHLRNASQRYSRARFRGS